MIPLKREPSLYEQTTELNDPTNRSFDIVGETDKDSRLRSASQIGDVRKSNDFRITPMNENIDSHDKLPN
jgi:hypothetical protein